MINRGLLKPGQIFLCREDPKKLQPIEDGIGWFTWGQSKSPEFSHVGQIYSDTEIAEQYAPKSRKLPVEWYDSQFDAGLLCIMEPVFWSVEYADRIQSWWDCHMGMPYGYDDIARFAGDGLLWRICPPVGRWFKKRDLTGDWDKSPVCSQALGLAVRYGKNDPNLFKRQYGIGIGREVPGDYYTMDCFRVVQDMRV